MTANKTTVIFLSKALNGGGAERSLLEMFSALDRECFKPLIWRLDPLNLYPKYLAKSRAAEVLPPFSDDPSCRKRVEYYSRRLPRYLLKSQAKELLPDSLRLYDRFQRFRKTNRSSVILVSSQFSMNKHAGILQWLCGYRIPVIFIEQNDPYQKSKICDKDADRELTWTRTREMYSRATHVIAVTKAIKQSLLSRFAVPALRVSIIPNPVDLIKVDGFARRACPRHAFYHTKGPVIICPARLHSQKNHHLLLRSFALIRRNRFAKLILLGDGPVKESLQRTITEMNLRSCVAIIGFKAEPYSLIAHADLTVLASYFEGHPLCLLESLACGIPVVCTDWKGANEIVQKGVNGILVPMQDKALANGLLAGLNLAHKRQAPYRARQSVARFNTPNIAAMYADLFLRIIRKNPLKKY